MGDDFKREFGLGVDRRRFTAWQRFMHNFEKKKSLRIAVALGIGTVMVGNLLAVIPGTRYMLQKEVKEATARSFLKLSYLSSSHAESTAIDTPGEWHASIRTVSHYTQTLQREVSLTQKLLNPFLLATEVDLLTCALRNSEKDLSLLYRSLDEVAEVLHWVTGENPKMFRNVPLFEALCAFFFATVSASLIQDRIAATAGLTVEERANWSTFLSLSLILMQFRSEATFHIRILQGIATVCQSRPWLYKLESEDLLGFLFRHTKSEVPMLRNAALDLLVRATQAGSQYYVANRLISNLITHVLPVYPDIDVYLTSLLLSSESTN